MSITTFSELLVAVGDRLARSDFTTAGALGECVAFCEAEMQRELRTLDMETKTATYALSQEFMPVPVDFLQVRSFWLNTSPRTALEYMPDDAMSERASVSGKSRFYNISGGNFRFYPSPDGSYTATLIYYAKIPSLSVSNTTNWLLTAHPDAYLYGACKHGAIRLKDAEGAQGYDSLFKAALGSIQRASDGNRWSGPGMAVRVG
jgi:hypothetical protein